MRKRLPVLMTDFYKTVHHFIYDKGMTDLVSYWTPRMSRLEGVDKVVMFGLQGSIKEVLIDLFNDHFFNVPLEEVKAEYKRVISNTMSEFAADTAHIEALHNLGYLPIQIKAVAEGTRVNIKTPIFEIRNTVTGFGWLVNYLETTLSTTTWQALTSATIAYRYRELVNAYFETTVEDGDPAYACGDFSMRGMGGIDAAETSGAAHLTSFVPTATIGAILWLEDYYNADITKEIVGKGTASTEHSVMSSYGKDREFEAYVNILNTIKDGRLSIVSDTYDYWNVLTNFMPRLKEQILARDGKVLIRGDSGDPVDIICGLENVIDCSKYTDENDAYKNKETAFMKREDCVVKFKNCYKKVTVSIGGWGNNEYSYNYKLVSEAEVKGTVELLWDVFGGTINSKGYKVLDAHIGAIYGDGITYERACGIYGRLAEKGFAVNNCILGVGSYTYQFNTRDTFGQALKSTHSIINGVERQIFKNPITDSDSFKKSQKGMCVVYREGTDVLYRDQLTIAEADAQTDNMLELVFKDGIMIKDHSLAEIRARLHG